MSTPKRLGSINVTFETVAGLLGIKTDGPVRPAFVTYNGNNQTIRLVFSGDELHEVLEGNEVPVDDIEWIVNKSKGFYHTVVVCHNYQTGLIYCQQNGIEKNNSTILTDNFNSIRGLRRPNIVFVNGWTLNPNMEQILNELKTLDY